MMNTDIMVSVIMATYNHESYVERAINSIIKQKLDFEIEVLIGEDHSTDNTAKVLRKMEESLPIYFHIYYRDTNWGMQRNFGDLLKKSRGKYLIILEGDDYWTYDLKLKEQVEFLESHEDYIAVAHNTEVVDKYGHSCNSYIYPECKKDEYTVYDFRNNILMGQTTTILHRNFYNGSIVIPRIVLKNPYPAGDQATNFLLACHGRIKCIQEKWSAYRYVNDSGTSFSATVGKDKEWNKKTLMFLRELNDYAKQIDNVDAKIAVESKFLLYGFRACLKSQIKNFSWIDWIRDFVQARFKTRFIFFLINMIFVKVANIFGKER